MPMAESLWKNSQPFDITLGGINALSSLSAETIRRRIEPRARFILFSII